MGQGLPSARPGYAQPLYTERMADVSLERIWAKLEVDEWPLDQYLRESAKAYDMTTSPFVESRRNPGTANRRTRYTMPLPQDVPRAVSMIVGLPQASKATNVYSL